MSYQIEHRLWQSFLKVAEHLHYRKASEELHISQPALSKQIQQLESLLGFPVFERHNRTVSLTPSGKYLQQELESYFKRHEEIIHHAKLLDQGLQGELKMGFVGSAMQKVIPDLLLRFEQSYPNIMVNLAELDNGQQVAMLQKNELDVGFVRMDQVPHEMEVRALLEDTFSLVLPSDHPLSEDNFSDLTQLKDEDFILFDSSYSKSYYDKVIQIFAEHGYHPKASHSTVNASSIFRLVENHLGISIVPTALSSGYNMKVKFIELKNIKQRTTLKMVWNTENKNPVLKQFIDSSSSTMMER